MPIQNEMVWDVLVQDEGEEEPPRREYRLCVYKADRLDWRFGLYDPRSYSPSEYGDGGFLNHIAAIRGAKRIIEGLLAPPTLDRLPIDKEPPLKPISKEEGAPIPSR